MDDIEYGVDNVAFHFITFFCNFKTKKNLV